MIGKQMAVFDMHVHSSASDGVYSPAELVVMAKERDLAGIALTDHDTTAGCFEARAKADELDFSFICGVELSAEYNDKDVHILGYWVDADSLENNSYMQEMRQARKQRCYDIVARLARLGVELDADVIIAQAGAYGVPGRPHIAQAMVEAGYCLSIKEAFGKWLDRKMPGYVARAKLEPQKAISIIIDSGGVPVLAHPGINPQDNLLPHMVEAGLGGIEVYHPDHNKQAEKKYLHYAHKYQLAATGGSDYHISGRRQLGCRITTLDQLVLLSKKRELLLRGQAKA